MQWETAFSDERAGVAPLAQSWLNEGHLPLRRSGQLAVAGSLAGVRWLGRSLPPFNRTAQRDPRGLFADYVRSQARSLGPSAQEVARLLWLTEGLTPGLVAERLEPGAVYGSPFSVLRRLPGDDGQQLLVRMRRPGVRRDIVGDLRIVGALLALSERRSEWVRQLRPRELLEAAVRRAVQETDLRHDALNTVELGLMAEELGTSGLRICPPRPGELDEQASYFTAPADAVPMLHAVEWVDAAAAVPGLLAVTVEGALTHGVFHADLRAEDLLVRPDGSLLLVGCTALGRLAPNERRGVFDYALALFSGDAQQQVDALVTMGAAPEGVSTALVADLSATLSLRTLAGLTEASAMRRGAQTVATLARRHGLRPPPQVIALFRSMLAFQAVVRVIAPRLSPVQAFFPLAPRLPGLGRRLSSIE